MFQLRCLQVESSGEACDKPRDTEQRGEIALLSVELSASRGESSPRRNAVANSSVEVRSDATPPSQGGQDSAIKDVPQARIKKRDIFNEIVTEMKRTRARQRARSVQLDSAEDAFSDRLRKHHGA